MNKPLRLTVPFILALNFLYAQSTLEGTVIDATTHQPVQGVAITSKKNKTGTTAGKDGRYTLPNEPAEDSLYFSSAGYRSQWVPVAHSNLFVLLTPAFANLDELVVTGNREIQRRTEVPVAINVISKSTINETRATRLDLLINKVPGVYMVDLGNEQHSMSVRQPFGTKNLFLYLEDGIPIRTVGDFNHNALIEINQASMERIEVIKGPAASLYGSEAVGGAINFITQSPSPFLSGKIQAEVGSRGYKRTDFTLSNTFKKFGFFISGYHAGQDQQDNQHNDFTKTALTVRTDYRFNDKLNLSAVADYIRYQTDQKGGLDSAHFYNKDYLSSYRFTYRQVDAFRLKSSLSKEWNAANKTTVTLFYRSSVISQNPFYSISNVATNPLKAKGQINEDAFKSYGAVLQHTTTVSAARSKLIAGLSVDHSPATYEARFIDIDKDAERIFYRYTASDSMLTNYQVDLLNTAAYAQLEYKPFNQLKIVAAARYDRLNYTFDNHLLPGAFTGAPDASDHFDHFTPKLGITYDFGGNKGAYINYSVGFAPPNITDLYTGVKVPVLNASSYNNYEVGGWISFAGRKGRAELSLYQLDGNNEIVSVRLEDGSYQNQNAGRTTHKGIEANLRYSPAEAISIRVAGSFSAHRYINYIEQGKDYSGNKMPQAPPLIYNSELSYKPARLKGFRIALEVQGMNRYFTNPQNTATYRGFTAFNARAGYAFKCLDVWVNCLNLTDKVFATTVEQNSFGTSYRPGQLRTINFGIAYNFRNQQ